MIVGVAKEIKVDERRVALTPNGARALTSHGHSVLVESGAGAGSSMADEDYLAAGATVVASALSVWAEAEMIMKVKEVVPVEFRFLRPGLILFTYLHLAANPELTQELLAKRVTALAYETVQLPDGSLPLLAPMSEIAGRLSIQAGAWCLQAGNGGRGVLLSGCSGARPGTVVVLGGGISGASACQVAAGIGARVTVIDVNQARLRYLNYAFGGQVTTLLSETSTIEEETASADLVIGAVLVPGARSPRLLSTEMVSQMRAGSALVDISIDQGGVSETSRPTTHQDPAYTAQGVTHYCVTNMPAVVPHTSTFALTSVTLPYAIAVADHGLMNAGMRNPALRTGLNTYEGEVTHDAVAEVVSTGAHSPWR